MRWPFALALALSVLALVCFAATGASAATYANACPTPANDAQIYGGTDTQCLAITERVEQLDADVATGDNPHRLDLMWWGEWAIVGLLLVLIMQPIWTRAFGFEGKLGHG